MTASLQVRRLEEWASADTPIHRLDARAKIITTMFFLAAVMSFPRYEVSALLPFLLYPVSLAARARIPWQWLARRIAWAAPFAVLIGLFNPIVDRQPMPGSEWVAGWFSWASIVLRVILTVSAALSLAACTGLYRLAEALGQLRLPRVFTVQLLFLYRYLFVLADEAHRVRRAWTCRSGRPGSLPLARFGPLAGAFLLRAIDRAQRIYAAMVARGFEGDIRGLAVARWTFKETAFVAAWAVFFLVARGWNVPQILGQALLEACR